MIVLKNKILTHVPPMTQKIDDLADLPYIPTKPLTPKSPAILIVGFSSSGKTTLWNQLLLSHPTKKNPDKPKFYYRIFDRIYIFSCSKDTLPLDKLNIPEERIFDKYSNEELQNILDTEKEGENLNNLIVFDDCIKGGIANNSLIHKLLLNRRHITQNPNEDNHAGLGILITSQVYNKVDLLLRKNMSDIFLFGTQNEKEIRAIKEELMSDLNPKEQDELLKKAWSKKYNFLLIKGYEPTENRYYINFDKVVFDRQKPEEEAEIETELIINNKTIKKKIK
jgi:hypothetical protein